MKHYKLTNETIVTAFGVTLFRIELTIDCKWGNIGDKGGFIESEKNLSGNAWVSDDARVYGNARVSDDARVSGNARVYDDAQVYGNARVSGNAWVYGNARVSGNAWVYGNARVYDDAWKESPLQIQGTKHFFNICAKGKIQIGCKSFEIEYWQNNFEVIGKEQGYTEQQIKEYGLYIELAKTLNK